MSGLTLAGRRFSLDELAAGTPGEEAERPPHVHAALDFCRRWLQGQAEFTLKTSGSTGAPRSITLTRERMRASARLTGAALDLKPGDRALVCLSTEYVAGLMMLVRGLELGLELTVVPPAANPLAGLPDEAAFDFAAFVPLQLQDMLVADPAGTRLHRMKAILVGGAPVGEALARRLATLAAPVYHTYGMTETVSHIALRRLSGPQADEYFTPLPGVELDLGPDECLRIRSVLTGQRWLATRDRVEWRADGAFRWLGRLDNVINSGGVKVQPEAVEAALGRLLQDYWQGEFADRRFFVGPLPDARYGQRVVVVMEGAAVAAELVAEIRARLRADLLREYEVPRAFHFLPRFLETPTGKIDRRANLAQSPDCSA